MSRFRIAFIWSALVIAVAVPIGVAATSPLLAWREPIYIAGGFAGVIAMVFILFQPLLAAGYLPELSIWRGRWLHRWVGSALVLSVVIHVAGLWVTSPPDVIDALLFVSPTPFSIWGVIAMWGVFATACLAAFRRRLQLHPRIWRLSHKTLAVVIVAGSVLHAMMIEGTMGTLSKSMLCAMVVVATLLALNRGRGTVKSSSQ